MSSLDARPSIAAAALAVVVFTGAVGLAQPKGATITIKGDAVDMWCYMEGGDRGPAKKECARDLLMDKMNEAVEATGTLVNKGGTQMIFIASVK